MVKLKVGRLSREVADSCLQYWGGMGFTNEVLVSRLYRSVQMSLIIVAWVLLLHHLEFELFICDRDFRLVSIGGGADEVMLAIICKYMGTLPSGKGKKWIHIPCSDISSSRHFILQQQPWVKFCTGNVASYLDELCWFIMNWIRPSSVLVFRNSFVIAPCFCFGPICFSLDQLSFHEWFLVSLFLLIWIDALTIFLIQLLQPHFSSSCGSFEIHFDLLTSVLCILMPTAVFICNWLLRF